MPINGFVVYPKEGEAFVLDVHRFEISNDAFTFYDNYDQIAMDRYLVFSNVAAIVPFKQRRTDNRFTIRLKNGRSFEICADSFKVDNTVKFFARRYTSEQEEVGGIYIAIAEVLAIVPLAYNGW
ncbi:MAG: hypothetical protein ACXW18_13905 [Pyrinomonadaceae bacterium]